MSIYRSIYRISDLREIFTAQGDVLQQLVEKYARHFPSDFLTEALDEEPYHSTFITPEYEEYEQAILSDAKVRFQGDAIAGPNQAWLWAHRYQPCELYVQGTSDFPIGDCLRRFGYVFWDSDRLQRSGILQKDPADIAQEALERFSRPKYLSEGVEDRIRKLSMSQRRTVN
ncbi:hypothetical protein B7463_g69, partial [Scytalidium lignicola]